MKFKISRETLFRPLQMVSGVVERRQTLPILSNVLLTAKDGKLTMTATDLEVEMISHVELDGVEVGETTLPARKFLDICRALPEGAEIQVTIDGEKAVVRSGKSRFVLATLPAADFPVIEADKSLLAFSVPQGRLKNAIDKTSFAMAQQDVRYYLNGMLIEISDELLRTVATDGHRLALCDTELNVKIKENQSVIMPRKGVMELVRLLGNDDSEAEVKIGNNFIQVSTAEMSFTSKLIDGRFPDYQNVIPVGGDKIVVSDQEVLHQALGRVSILSNEKYRGVRLQFSAGLVKISAHNPEQEEAEEEVAVDYNGDSLEIGFNVNYLQDAVAASDTEQVRLTLTDPNSCCLVQGVGDKRCKYIVMPMRL